MEVIACWSSNSWHAAIGPVLSFHDEVRETLNVRSWRDQTFDMGLGNDCKVPILAVLEIINLRWPEG